MSKTAECVGTERPRSQAQLFAETYRRGRRWRRLYFAARYARRRLHEVAATLGLDLESKRVLDVGFGTGYLLASFPPSCALAGAEVSRSAVEEARRDPRFARYRGAEFSLVREDCVDDLPKGPFDVVVSSHSLEHVPDDRAMLAAIRERLRPGGVLFLFVPIEEPHYNPNHRHSYSLDSIAERVERAGFERLFLEGSLHANGHVWKLITIPSRRGWPVLGLVVDALRVTTLSLVPYRAHRLLDRVLGQVGAGPRQAFLVARRPSQEYGSSGPGSPRPSAPGRGTPGHDRGADSAIPS